MHTEGECRYKSNSGQKGLVIIYLEIELVYMMVLNLGVSSFGRTVKRAYCQMGVLSNGRIIKRAYYQIGVSSKGRNYDGRH